MLTNNSMTHIVQLPVPLLPWGFQKAGRILLIREFLAIAQSLAYRHTLKTEALDNTYQQSLFLRSLYLSLV